MLRNEFDYLTELCFLLANLVFRSLAVSNVLHRSEHVRGLAGRVPFHIALKVGDAHFAGWPDQATFGVEAGPAAESLLHASLPIFGVDLFLTGSYVHRTFLRLHSIDAIGLIRPVHATCQNIPFPVADMGNALGLFKLGFALLQIA